EAVQRSGAEVDQHVAPGAAHQVGALCLPRPRVCGPDPDGQQRERRGHRGHAIPPPCAVREASPPSSSAPRRSRSPGAGAGAGGGWDTPKNLTPDQLLQKARQTADTVTSYRLNVAAKIQATAGTGNGASTVRRLLGRPLDVSGEGPVNASSGDASLDIATR